MSGTTFTVCARGTQNCNKLVEATSWLHPAVSLGGTPLMMVVAALGRFRPQLDPGVPASIALRPKVLAVKPAHPPEQDRGNRQAVAPPAANILQMRLSKLPETGGIFREQQRAGSRTGRHSPTLGRTQRTGLG